MTIQEKAKDFAAEFNTPRALKYGFEKGAEWMLNEIEDWFRNQQTAQYSAWCEMAQRSLEQFKKTIEK